MSRALGVPEVKRVSIKKIPMESAPHMGKSMTSRVPIKRAAVGPELDQRNIRPVKGIDGERESGSKVNTYHGLNANAHMRMK